MTIEDVRARAEKKRRNSVLAMVVTLPLIWFVNGLLQGRSALEALLGFALPGFVGCGLVTLVRLRRGFRPRAGRSEFLSVGLPRSERREVRAAIRAGLPSNDPTLRTVEIADAVAIVRRYPWLGGACLFFLPLSWQLAVDESSIGLHLAGFAVMVGLAGSAVGTLSRVRFARRYLRLVPRGLA